MSEWISVKDGLPKYNDRVIFFNGEYVEFGVYHRDFTDFEDCIHDEVTHWMPLPEPPKE